MRNPERIKRILDKLEKLWNNSPDLRLGQLISNLVDTAERNQFYIQDEDLEKVLNEYIRRDSAYKKMLENQNVSGK